MVTQLVNVALGIWLMAAPAVLDSSDAARTNDRIVGPVAAACAVIALHEVARSLRWVILALGLWLVVAPWMFGYELTALLNSAATGLLLICCALVRGARRQRLGGGWPSIWKTKLASAG